jgi:cation:H+ antiporter
MPMWKAGLWLLVGLALLLVGSRLVVFGATEIARWLGVSDLVIGLTVIAIGTSLPELAASIMCVLKNEDDIAVGNVVGSNMFNLLGVMGIPGLIMPFQVPAEALSRDFVLMFALTIALFGMSFGFGGNHGRITRLKGAALLGSFLAYMLYLAVTSV